jgi:electron transfer flavoprotein alpha subunit
LTQKILRQAMDSDKSVMVFVEWSKGEAAEVSLEVLNKGRSLASQLKGELQAVMMGEKNQEVLAALAGFGADRVFFPEDPLRLEEDPELFAKSLSRLCAEKRPAIVLFGATIFGNDLAGRLTARLKTGLVMDCFDLSLNEKGILLQTRLIHGGRIAATFVCPRSTPQIATVVPGVFEKKRPNLKKETKVEVYTPTRNGEERRFKIIGREKADPEAVTLDEAEIIVSGGRGMGSRENFELVRELARRLGGVIGASLGAVDAELAPRKCLVGQTGTTVTPDLYVTCGISGSIYHVLGMKDAKAIVAINKDPRAEIFKYSDMGLVGDAVEIIKAINNRFASKSEKQVHG